MTQLNWRIVDRYLAGEATTEEQRVVEQWLADSAAFRMLLAELHRGTLDDETIRQAAAEVRARLERDMRLAHEPSERRIPQPSVILQPSARGFSLRRTGALKAAAAIAVLLGGSLIVSRTVQTPNVSHAEATLRTITAPIGRRVSVSLPDGSRVILSPGSSLRYLAAGFGTPARREVRLEGEAYFDVIHDATRPFIVQAGALVAEDLGTQFVVRAYPEDRHGLVVVRQGLVGIGGEVVAPGQVGRLEGNGKLVVESADTTSWFAWTHGKLAFTRMPLREALPKLSRWYGLEFRLADPSLGHIELSADFPEQLSGDALDALETVLGLRVTRQGRVVTFYSSPMSSSSRIHF